ncbi:MFS general substrate transporter [Punctularia strigosozonata HHB-11173 SS5]|uniref:MFS general substrate transporter n=1 Tax=Punctularia strigosozonata (strain HHB-11173) TaxID=741275 RepID=UPI0004418066|nr:MFS general substrate transporter [Punctularia strigosozonata HHB-11173 SS5]EIN13832.1 MFS general substrate transporter [Punctularia strigosozonata HHB-11173 SS5]
MSQQATSATSWAAPPSEKSLDLAEKHLNIEPETNAEVAARAWKKVDLRVMSVSVLLYLASYIDRANIGNAKVLGMAKDLNLSADEYNWALSIFFIGYVVFETPSNIILKRLRPRIYIPNLVIIWGVVCCLVSTVKSASGLLAVRFFLGLAEAGFLPGLIYWIGCWYPRPMQGTRFAVLYSSVSLTGAFGGLLATGINSAGGSFGLAGWKWIFIVEGTITIGFGLLSWLFMSDYPETVSWLTDEEREIVIRANEADRALHAMESFNKRQIITAFTDYRTYLWGFIYFLTYIPVYSVVLSLPSVVVGLGYQGTTATLMACPPYAFGFVIVLLAGYSSDRTRDRYYHFILGCLVAMIALIVLMTVKSDKVRYGMFFLVSITWIMMFMFVPISISWSWLANNVASTNKRAAATAVVFSMGNIGGAISGQIYRAEWAPRYVKGHAINLGCYCGALVAVTLLWISYKHDNARRDREAGERISRKSDMLGEDLGDLGDR